MKGRCIIDALAKLLRADWRHDITDCGGKEARSHQVSAK